MRMGMLNVWRLKRRSRRKAKANKETQHIAQKTTILFKATAMSSFLAYLRGKGLQLDGITPSDGNCFFWAVSEALLSCNIEWHFKKRTKTKGYWISQYNAHKRKKETWNSSWPYHSRITFYTCKKMNRMLTVSLWMRWERSLRMALKLSNWQDNLLQERVLTNKYKLGTFHKWTTMLLSNQSKTMTKSPSKLLLSTTTQ